MNYACLHACIHSSRDVLRVHQATHLFQPLQHDGSLDRKFDRTLFIVDGSGRRHGSAVLPFEYVYNLLLRDEMRRGAVGRSNFSASCRSRRASLWTMMDGSTCRQQSSDDGACHCRGVCLWFRRASVNSCVRVCVRVTCVTCGNHQIQGEALPTSGWRYRMTSECTISVVCWGSRET